MRLVVRVTKKGEKPRVKVIRYGKAARKHIKKTCVAEPNGAGVVIHCTS